MSALHIYETAPLGSLVRFSNGQPRPPQRFTRKLRAWENENGVGRLTERRPEHIAATYRSPAGFCLHLGDCGGQGVIMITVRRHYSVESVLHFEIFEAPAPGTVRVLTTFGGRDELLHLAPDMTAAEQWMANNRHSNMRVEIVADPDPVVLPTGKGMAA